MLEPNRNRTNGCWKRKTNLEKRLTVGCLLLTAIAVIFAVLFFLKEPSASIDDECRTKHCVKAAAELLDFVDLKANPCEQFYKFVCGSYFKNAVKKGYPSPFISVNEEYKNELKSLVVNPIKKKDSNSVGLLKQYYHECMNESKIDLDNNQAFIKAINEMGGWPLLNGTDWKEPNDFSWVEWYAKAKKLGLPVYGFFTFIKVETAQKSTVLQITGQSEDAKVFISEYKYKDVMQNVLEAFGVTDFNEKENQEVLNFMKKLKKLAFSPTDRMAVVEIKDLIAKCPSVPWLRFLNSVADDQMKFSISSEVAFGEITKYCESIDKLMNATEPRTIINYFVWSIIHQTFQFLSKDVRNAYSEISFSYKPRYEVCFGEADNRFKYTKEAAYIRKRTPPAVKKQLTEMIEFMKEVFVKHLEECDWMDEQTKNTAIKKAKAIENFIGGEDELYDDKQFDKIIGIDGFKFTTTNMFEMAQQKTIRENQHLFRTIYAPQNEDWDEFFKNLMKVNAFFSQPYNLMIIPAPILSSIFYNSKMPAYMNYGSMGRLIGHEIMHGFQKSGRHVLDKNGNMLDWWTVKTAESYDDKVKCVIDEYEGIKFRYKLNGTLTLDENLSDFVGVDVAYEAYKKYVEKYGPEKKVPGIPLTPEQVFWVKTGTFLCFRKLDDDSVDYEEEDEHAIPAFRVQAGARSSKYFAQDFQCKEGTMMNPKEKCRVL